MTGWDLRLWRKSLFWSREKAAQEMGVSLRTWHTWENATEISRSVELATAALSAIDVLRASQEKDSDSVLLRLENTLAGRLKR